MKHIIQKQVIELQLAKEENAFRMQHLISEHYRNEMVPLLEMLFNDYCSEDETLVVDKLEIDFGLITEKDLEKNRWDEHLLATFKSNLRNSLASMAVSKSFVRQSKAMNHCRQWMAYMQTGFLPWNALEINDAWYQHVLETLATDYNAIASLRTMILKQTAVGYRIALQHDAVFLSKLVAILTAEKQQHLQAAAEEIYLLLQFARRNNEEQLPAEQVIIKAVWQQFLIAAASGRKNASTEAIAAQILQPYAHLLPNGKKQQKELLVQMPVLQKLINHLLEAQNLQLAKTQQPVIAKPAKQKKQQTQPGGEGNEPEEKESKDTAPAENDKLVKIKSGDEIKATESIAAKENQSNDGKKTGNRNEAAKPANETVATVPVMDNNVSDPVKKVIEPEQQEDIAPAVENMLEKILPRQVASTVKKDITGKALFGAVPAEGIFIPYAGLVLTHPFLGFLFRRLHWMEGNRFVNDEAQVKAVFILHWLATGETKAQEHELVFCKLICACPLDEPLPAEMNFTTEEKDEANDMLQAILQQWSKLQNTTVAGLREGFLQRSGKLLVKNNEPCVQVEKSAIDILLDFLPWNISLVKLPWMKELLRVEWR